VEYGFVHDDSNRNTAPFSRRAGMYRASVSLKAAGNGTYRSLPPLPWLMARRSGKVAEGECRTRGVVFAS
jgi:hypothetical protein